MRVPVAPVDTWSRLGDLAADNGTVRVTAGLVEEDVRVDEGLGSVIVRLTEGADSVTVTVPTSAPLCRGDVEAGPFVEGGPW